MIRLNDEEVRRLQGVFSGVLPRELTRAKRSALTRTRRGAKKRVSSLLTSKRGGEQFNIGPARVKRRTFLSKIRDDAFFVRGSNKPFSLTSFSKTNQLWGGTTKDGRKKQSGVSVMITKGKRQRIHSAFMLQKGSKQVFRREFVGGRQSRRYPIERLVGPSVADMMNRKDAESDLADFLLPRFDQELKSAIRYALMRGRK